MTLAPPLESNVKELDEVILEAVTVPVNVGEALNTKFPVVNIRTYLFL